MVGLNLQKPKMKKRGKIFPLLELETLKMLYNLLVLNSIFYIKI